MLLAGLLALLLSCLSQAANAGPAAQPVEKLNAVLIQVMKDAKRLGYSGRYKKLEPVIKEVFEFEAIAQVVLGGHWKKLDSGQKQAFITKLTDLSVATYAAQFDGYDGQTFRYEATDEIKPDRALVRYTMNAPKGNTIKFEYIVDRKGATWRIVNVVVDGISDLALKKGQYMSVIDREGFDSLLAKLTQKISDYANKKK
jgi:phospholipid transport system substrate-binding protein